MCAKILLKIDRDHLPYATLCFTPSGTWTTCQAVSEDLEPPHPNESFFKFRL